MINIRITLLLLLVFTGCISNKKYQNKSAKRGKYYILVITGVECAVCAKKAVLALEKVPTILHAEYICNDSEFEDCFAKIWVAGRHINPPIAAIQRELLSEGFVLSSIVGHFYGRPNTNKTINLAGSIYPFYTNNQTQILHNKLKKFNGKFVSNGTAEWIEIE